MESGSSTEPLPCLELPWYKKDLKETEFAFGKIEISIIAIGATHPQDKHMI